MKLCGLLAGLLLVAHSAFAATLREAIRAGELEQVRASLDAGASANETDDLGATPLHDAVWLGEEAIVRLLVDRGARVDSKHTEAGSTPWHISHCLSGASAFRHVVNLFRRPHASAHPARPADHV